MKVKLKDSLSLFRGYLSYQMIQAGNLSSDIKTLSRYIKYVTKEECDENNIFELLRHIENSKPSWFVFAETFLNTLEKEKGISGYTNLMACISSEYPNLEIDFRKCPFAKLERITANPKERRTPFHINVPDSIYAELTGAVKSLLIGVRKDEKDKISHKDDKIICKFANEYVKPVNVGGEFEMVKKIWTDGWSVRTSTTSYYASKSADETVRGETICDLFEAIYGTREYNKDLKPIKKN